MPQASKRTPVKSHLPKGSALLHDPLYNKGTAFTRAERAKLGLEGLLPPYVHTIEDQVARVLDAYRAKTTDLERYIHLVSLQDRNETLFYKVVMDNLEQMMPIIYTPTVGQACQQWGHLFRHSRGIYITIKEKGQIAKILKNWPQRDVRVIVVTDGERILGLGDLGCSGMGIPVGKLALYTSCAAINPAQCLPVLLDVGTENQAFLKDPLYLGMRQGRVRGKKYDEFVKEFVDAAQKTWPGVLVQFEDFGNLNAFRLLEQHRDRVLTFNDDIQGTAGVVLAGLYSAMRVTGKALKDQTVLFLGAGEAGVGIGSLIAAAMMEEGLSEAEARARCWFVDSKGLVVKSREGLAEHKLIFAHDAPQCPDLLTAVKTLKPTALIGVSTLAKSFNQAIVEEMSRLNERPIVFALSNPTSKAECTAQEAYEFSRGKAIYASGSPFPPYTYEGKTLVPGQGNNAYVFPGIGLGVVACQAKHVTDRMFMAAAKALAGEVQQSDLDMGRMYPSLTRIQEVSLTIAVAVAQVAYEDGLARAKKPANLRSFIKAQMWVPKYLNYV